LAKLIYFVIQSLDGFVEDSTGKFDWAAPDEEVHRFANDLEQSVGTHLMGRRMYETMVYWETAHLLPGQEPFMLDYARTWQAADKVVYSKTLAGASSARTRIEREFDAQEVRRMKDASEHDISVAGPDLAGQAMRAGLVDELHLLVVPTLVGSGKKSLPSDMELTKLELLGERRFGNGTVYLQYRVVNPG